MYAIPEFSLTDFIVFTAKDSEIYSKAAHTLETLSRELINLKLPKN